MKKSPIVASLPGPRFSHPYSSIALSPDRAYAVVSGKDTLRVLSVGSHGINEIHSIRVAKYFHAPSSNVEPINPSTKPSSQYNGSAKNTFDLRNFQHGRSSSDSSRGREGRGSNVTITDVAWSHANFPVCTVAANNQIIGVGNNNNVGNTNSGASSTIGGGANNTTTNNNNLGKNDLTAINSAKLGSSMNNPSGMGGGSVNSGASTSTSPHHSLGGTGDDETAKLRLSAISNDSIVAAAGSNGVVVAWHAQTALLDDMGIHNNNEGEGGEFSSSWQHQHKKFAADASVIGQPEAVLAEHTRAVNRLAWHRRRPDLLLTASQDSTVKLWDRRASGTTSETTRAPNKNAFRGWFRFNNEPSLSTTTSSPSRSIPSWYCASTFQPKCEAVRDIKWSPFIEEAFAFVTDAGILAIYDMRLTARPWTKIPAHAGEATTVDWHPTRPYVIATGGGRDRSVKIWDVHNGLSSEYGDIDKFQGNFDRSESGELDESLRTVSSLPEKETSSYYRVNSQSAPSSFQIASNRQNNSTLTAGQLSYTSSFPASSSRFAFKGSLPISAPITRIQWRPPNKNNLVLGSQIDNENIDHHDAMLAVATAPISGTNYGGAGSIELWSVHRPFMALSVVEGHQNGAVTDFVWIDTPSIANKTRKKPDHFGASTSSANSWENKRDTWGGASVGTGSDPGDPRYLDEGSLDMIMSEMTTLDHQINHTKAGRSSSFSGGSESKNETRIEGISDTQGTWQHVLSVGRDGRCLLQNLERGGRPISQVPRSTFAIANLSPFQSGSGSLQIMSVHQKVPSGQHNDFALTRLRRDAGTAQAPGVFSEIPEPLDVEYDKNLWFPKQGGQREPAHSPQLVFSVTDPGDLDEPNLEEKKVISVAPELVHVSRFAESYRLNRDTTFPTRSSLCLHNAEVAERWFGPGSLSRMWKLLASILEGTGHENVTTMNNPSNVMDFVLSSTIRNLLLERANAGDVQTCVAICEVVGVFLPPRHGKNVQGPENATAIPGLSAELVREWYLSYIDILQQMCLFSQAAELIRTCKDSQVAALNQQSTSIHMSCPVCAKPLDGATEGFGINLLPVAQRACGSCRSRIGMCFLCHNRVTGMYVYCPGCGCGGHLEHALEWFGGIQGRPVREYCPTGCGHKCNRLRQISAFPKTKSLMNYETEINFNF